MKLTSILLASSLAAIVVAFFGSLPAFAVAVTTLILASFCRDYAGARSNPYFAEVAAIQHSALPLAA